MNRVAKGIIGCVAGTGLLWGAGAAEVERTEPDPAASMTVLADEQVDAQRLNIIW